MLWPFCLALLPLGASVNFLGQLMVCENARDKMDDKLSRVGQWRIEFRYDSLEGEAERGVGGVVG
jgi:hypothetical protein